MRLAKLILAGAGSLAAATSAPAQPVMQLNPGEALVSVETEGRSLARPDEMTISAGTITTGTTASEAVRANNALAEQLIEAVRGQGVGARDVRTSNFQVQPRFEGERDGEDLDRDGRPPRIVGYVVENTVRIRIRDLSAAQSLISRLFEAGANSVGGPSFALSDDRPAVRAAERDAVAQGRAEAENYAAAAGRRLGRLLRISDRRVWRDADGEIIYVTGSRIPATPIEPGELETRVTVHMDFALAPQ